ncbi:hypothetical protein PtA15_18A299 [Puccinia triticina]|uniref:Uncharacterized protein n=1 Tax=Puccinia triticina TaxID=208348 RepID=A0ABY7D794_9BASI|nr:uncharacterized protein PtA15_18A299 [Puccinia triticina]WAQ93241.1 hypothetical protein PtA15_18A299 [Puccinia triticina]
MARHGNCVLPGTTAIARIAMQTDHQAAGAGPHQNPKCRLTIRRREPAHIRIPNPMAGVGPIQNMAFRILAAAAHKGRLSFPLGLIPSSPSSTTLHRNSCPHPSNLLPKQATPQKTDQTPLDR